MGEQSVKGKVAIITGSSMGIGKAIAFELGRKGAKIVLNGREVPKLNKAKQELEANGADVIAIAADVRYLEDCQRQHPREAEDTNGH